MKGRDEVTAPKPQTAAFENPADTQAMAEVEAAIAAGRDPFGDLDDDTTAAAPAAAPAPAPTEAAAPPAPEEVDEVEDTAAASPAAAPAPAAAAPAPAAEAPAPATAPVPAPAPPAPTQFRTRSGDELKTAQADLFKKKSEAFAEYSAGTMTPEAFAAIDQEVMQGLMGLASEQTLAQANAQTALQTQESVIAGIQELAVKQGHFDYRTDTKASRQFNTAVEALGADPDMLKLPDAEFYAKAHEMVLFMRGVAPGAAAAPAPGPAPARADMAAPITLRGIPAAATPNANGGVTEELSRLEGLDFEDRIGQMPRAQRDAYLDS